MSCCSNHDCGFRICPRLDFHQSRTGTIAAKSNAIARPTSGRGGSTQHTSSSNRNSVQIANPLTTVAAVVARRATRAIVRGSSSRVPTSSSFRRRPRRRLPLRGLVTRAPLAPRRQSRRAPHRDEATEHDQSLRFHHSRTTKHAAITNARVRPTRAALSSTRPCFAELRIAVQIVSATKTVAMPDMLIAKSLRVRGDSRWSLLLFNDGRTRPVRRRPGLVTCGPDREV